MRRRSYTAIPVIDKDGKYVGTISEGDLLYSIIPEGDSERIETVPLKSLENFPISRIIQKDSYPAVRITVSMEEMLERALKQNFIPVVDDEDTFIGIVTRNSIIQYYASGKK